MSAPSSKAGGALLSGIASLNDIDLENQRVFLRADLDVPTSKGVVLDDAKLLRILPTLQRLTSSGARVVLASPFGVPRISPPKGPAGRRASTPPPASSRGPASSPPPSSKGAPKLPSIEAAAARLSELSGSDVFLPDDCVGESVKKVIGELREGQICVLENLALRPEDAATDEGFARQFLQHCDVYVNDSLSSCEGTSATTTVLPRLLDKRAAGPNLIAELEAIARLSSGQQPFTVLLGGSRLTDKLEVLQTLLPRISHLCVAGVPANTLVAARGGEMGSSHVEDDYLAGARTLIEQAGSRLVVPQDFVSAHSVKAAEGHVVEAGKVAKDQTVVDLGPRSVSEIVDVIRRSASVLWWGPIGFHKNSAFATGTRRITEALAECPGFTMALGEDSVAAARSSAAEAAEKLSCLSAGGSASVALLSGKKLPGLEALRGMAQ